MDSYLSAGDANAFALCSLLEGIFLAQYGISAGQYLFIHSFIESIQKDRMRFLIGKNIPAFNICTVQ